MSSHDHVTIDPLGRSLADVAEVVFGLEAVADAEGDYEAEIGGVLVALWEVDLFDDRGVDWSNYPLSLIFMARDTGRQEEVATAVYEHLVEVTDWALVLSFDELMDVRDRRPALTSA
jgi:hypothetical protein